MALRADQSADKRPPSIIVHGGSIPATGPKVLVSPVSPGDYVATLAHSWEGPPSSPTTINKQRTSEDVCAEPKRMSSYAPSSDQDADKSQTHMLEEEARQGSTDSRTTATARLSQRKSTAIVLYPPRATFLTIEPPSPVTQILTFEQHLLWVLVPLFLAAAAGALTFGLLLHFHSNTAVYIVVIVAYFAFFSAVITIVGKKMKIFAHRKWDKMLVEEGLTTRTSRGEGLDPYDKEAWQEWTLRRRSTERTATSSRRTIGRDDNKNEEEEELNPSSLGQSAQAQRALTDGSDDDESVSPEIQRACSRQSTDAICPVSTSRLATKTTSDPAHLCPMTMQIDKTRMTTTSHQVVPSIGEALNPSIVATQVPSSQRTNPVLPSTAPQQEEAEATCASFASQSTDVRTTVAVAGTSATTSAQSLPTVDSKDTFYSDASRVGNYGASSAGSSVNVNIDAHARGVENSAVIDAQDNDASLPAEVNRKNLVGHLSSRHTRCSLAEEANIKGHADISTRKVGRGERGIHLLPPPTKVQVKQRIEQMTQAIRRQQQQQQQQYLRSDALQPQRGAKETSGVMTAVVDCANSPRLETSQQQRPYENQVRKLAAVASTAGRPGEDPFPSYQQIAYSENDSTFADADESVEVKMKRIAGRRSITAAAVGNVRSTEGRGGRGGRE